MNNIKKSESGMTLVELIGAIAILFIISALTFPLIMNGIKISNEIQQETMFRDEADYLMAALLKDLYTTKETNIKKKVLLDQNNPSTNYYIEKKNGDITGFNKNDLFVSNRVIKTKNNSIKLLTTSTIELIGEGEYEIILWLEMTGKKKKEMKFENTIRTINDKEIES